MNLRPINDWILVKLDPIEEKVGSLVIPGGINHRTATIEKLGPGKWSLTGGREPMDLDVGDRVVFNRVHGEHGQGRFLLSLLGGDHLLIKPQDILFVMNEEVTVSE